MTRKINFAARVLIGLALLAFTNPVAADNFKCSDTIAGSFTSTLSGGPTCTSPIGVCTTGVLTGDLEATYNFTMLTLSPSGNPNDPTEFHYTGSSVVDLGNGNRIFGNDSGVMHINPNPAGPSPFTTTVAFRGGEGAYEGAVGKIVATGVLIFATGNAEGSYSAAICSRKHND